MQNIFQNKMERILVVGDIHGGFKALHQVFGRAGVTEDDTLIFLGDYVDGWSESSQIIEFLIELSKKQKCIFIKGNHDAWCEDWLSLGKSEDVWLSNGGKSTVNSYSDYGLEDLNRHLEFFKKMKNYYVDEHNRLFIHAGYSSMHGPEKEVIPATTVANIWNLDTGAAFTGALSMMDADTKEFWQSDLLSVLYPEENGRNRVK
jgi:serine/threonine protein phosphatase 1